MKLIEDGGAFDDLQQALIGALIDSIKYEIASENLNKETSRNLLEKISFSIAVILDGNRDAIFNGKEVFPFLTFQNEDDDLISAGGNSWMHEYVFGVIKEIHEDEAP